MSTRENEAQYVSDKAELGLPGSAFPSGGKRYAKAMYAGRLKMDLVMKAKRHKPKRQSARVCADVAI